MVSLDEAAAIAGIVSAIAAVLGLAYTIIQRRRRRAGEDQETHLGRTGTGRRPYWLFWGSTVLLLISTGLLIQTWQRSNERNPESAQRVENYATPSAYTTTASIATATPTSTEIGLPPISVPTSRGVPKTVEIPAGPSNISMDSPRSDTMQIRWTDSSNNEDGFVIRNDKDAKEVVLPPNSTQYDWKGLTEYELFCATVRAFNSAGSTEGLGTHCARTMAIPYAPTGPSPSDGQVFSTRPPSTNLSWTPIYIGGNVTYYVQVQREQESGSWADYVGGDASTNSYSMWVGGPYHLRWRVRGFNEGGEAGPFSAWWTITYTT